jgi:dTDP-4-dehydrorhamnose 3,5-epimerase
MKFREQKLKGLFVFDLNEFKDDRGMLTKYFYSDLFNKFNFQVDDIYTTVSHENVVRGLHHQITPYGQAKLVTCLSGEFWDISVDLRKESKTYGEQFSYKLSAGKAESLLVPAGFSHGTVSLESGTVMLSICSGKYMPEHEAGINISSLNLDFLPGNCVESLVISPKDKHLPPLQKML